MMTGNVRAAITKDKNQYEGEDVKNIGKVVNAAIVIKFHVTVLHFQ